MFGSHSPLLSRGTSSVVRGIHSINILLEVFLLTGYMYVFILYARQDSMLVTVALCLVSECCCLLFRMASSLCGPALPEWPLGTSERALEWKLIPTDWVKMDFDLQPVARYYLVRNSLVVCMNEFQNEKIVYPSLG